jgi:signal transduction histidine kinase
MAAPEQPDAGPARGTVELELELLDGHRRAIGARADRMFAGVLLCECLAAVAFALLAAVRGTSPAPWLAVAARGAAVVAAPIYAALRHPGRPVTRHAIAIGQGLAAGLLAHGPAGAPPGIRFVLLGSLLLVAGYRDAAALLVASAATVAGDLIGCDAAGCAAAALPYAGAVAIIDLLLLPAIRASQRDMAAAARKQAALEAGQAALEREVADRQRTERQLAVHYIVTRLLATSSTIGEVAPLLLETVGRDQGWDVGELWEVEETEPASERRLRCVEVWRAAGYDGDAYLAARRALRIGPEEGLPGRVWQRRLPLWAADMTDPGFPLDAFRTAPDLRAGFATPLRKGAEVIGVVAFYSRGVRPADDDHLSMVSALGGQIGQFMDRKRIEAGLRATHALLESHVAARTSELRETNQRLEEEIERRELAQRELRTAKDLADAANRAKSTFLASMSHELRTPLNAVIGFSELLEQEIFGALTDKQRSYVGNVLISGRHLLQLVNDVLDISKVEAGRMDLSCEWTPLGAIVDVVRSVLFALATKKGINLEVAVPSDLPDLYVDPGRMKQILYNLVANGIKFTPRGGTVRLAASVAPAGPDGAGRVVIDVADTGVGIAAEDLSRLFREFEQIPQAGGVRPEGTGLGLALTRRLVALHGGEVGVTSQVGRGSIFSVTLPLRRP